MAVDHQNKCCCKHSDARQCLLLRHPEIRRDADIEGDGNPLYWAFEDEQCECYCHVEIEADRREFEPEDWEVRP